MRPIAGATTPTVANLFAPPTLNYFEQQPIDARLVQACPEAPHEEIEALLNSGANVNAIELDRATLNSPLHYAAYRKMPLLVDLLLDRGANVEWRNARRQTPLAVALADPGDYAVAIRLLRAGATLDAPLEDTIRHDMQTDFHLAFANALVECGHEEILRSAARTDRSKTKVKPLQAFLASIDARRAVAEELERQAQASRERKSKPGFR